MIKAEKTVSVPKAAIFCGVTRSTINNWINSKKLYARRSGRNYLVPKKELLLFLRSTGKRIPPELGNDDFQEPVFKSLQPCWEYWKGSDHGDGCGDCVVSSNQLTPCFTAKESKRLHCPDGCEQCRYYRDIYLPRIDFIHQIELPAAVCKGLYFWGANNRLAEISRIPQKNFPGTGIESVIHPDSLEAVISNIKKMELGEPVPMTQSIFLKNKPSGKLRSTICMSPLNEPSGAFLILADINDG